jgi:hypothetical protein
MTEKRFPNVKILPSGKYFILVDNGIYIYNSNFSLNKSITNFSNDECLNEEDYNKAIITEFKDDNNNNFYIICLVKAQFLYIFESQKEILYKSIINIDKTRNYYNLIPLKMEYPNFHYIISFIKGFSIHNINLFHNSVNISKEDNNNNENIYNKEWGPFDNIKVSQDHISCNKISGQKFICFYKESDKNLSALIFNETLKICKSQTKKTSYIIQSIKSSSDIKKNCLVCIHNQYGLFCYSYNIDNNTFSDTILSIGESNPINPKLKTYYFPETNQYSFIYFYNTNDKDKAGIVILDENFQQILNETKTIDPPNLISTEFSLIYSITNEKYILFYDEKKKWKLGN